LIPALFALGGGESVELRALWGLRVVSALALGGAAWIAVRRLQRDGLAAFVMAAGATALVLDPKIVDFSINGMESGTTVYTSVVPSEVKAQDLGNAVVLTGVAAISVNSQGKANSFRVRFTDVWENQNGTWRMITWQSTKIPE
jgi:hypothetical protein